MRHMKKTFSGFFGTTIPGQRKGPLDGAKNDRGQKSFPKAVVFFVGFVGFIGFVSLDTKSAGQSSAAFTLEETTIAQIHAAMRAKRLTCRGLVEQYLKRIEAFDKQGPALNAITVFNPTALNEADAMDRRLAQGGALPALHCVPIIVKDNFETIGPAERGRLAHPERLCLRPRRVPSEEDQRRRRDRPREIEHGASSRSARTRR